MWDHMQGYGVMGYGGIFGAIIWLLLIAGVIIGSIWLVGSFRPTSRNTTPMDVLKQRYASGEISEEEYHKMKKEIES